MAEFDSKGFYGGVRDMARQKAADSGGFERLNAKSAALSYTLPRPSTCSMTDLFSARLIVHR
jgi:hypothetical protein